MFSGKGITIGRLSGIELRLDWSWFLIVAVIVWVTELNFSMMVPHQPVSSYWIFGIITALLFFASVLFHELAHSLVGKKIFGIAFKKITLFIFGGAAELDEGEDKNYPIPSAGAEFWMSLAGPLATFVLAGIFFELAAALGSDGVRSLWLEMLKWLFFANLVLGIFNLLPGFPMDGGRILRSFLWWKTNNLWKSTKIAYWIGITTSASLFLASFWIGVIDALWIGYLVFFLLLPAAGAEYLSIAPDSDRMKKVVETISVLPYIILVAPALLFILVRKMIRGY